MTQARKDELKGLVGRLEAQDQTNLGGGMLAGLDHARVARLPPGMLTRVILFTDGLANAGPAKSSAELLALLDANLGPPRSPRSATATTPTRSCSATSRRAGRATTPSSGPEDALTAFARELGGLLSTYAQNIEIAVTPRPGFVLTDVVSDVDATEERGAVKSGSRRCSPTRSGTSSWRAGSRRAPRRARPPRPSPTWQ